MMDTSLETTLDGLRRDIGRIDTATSVAFDSVATTINTQQKSLDMSLQLHTMLRDELIEQRGKIYALTALVIMLFGVTVVLFGMLTWLRLNP